MYLIAALTPRVLEYVPPGARRATWGRSSRSRAEACTSTGNMMVLPAARPASSSSAVAKMAALVAFCAGPRVA